MRNSIVIYKVMEYVVVIWPTFYFNLSKLFSLVGFVQVQK